MKGKKIILGICGGIAAYKAVDLVSQLTKEGADVHVVLTENAAKFVSPLSLQVMSGNKIYSQEILVSEISIDIDHIKLADEADLVLVAPATANALAKFVTGISDGILYDLVLATKAPILIAPAMNTNMWEHATTKRNIHVLKESLNYHFIEPESGTLACGHVGQGRLPEIESIINKAKSILDNNPMPEKKTSVSAQPLITKTQPAVETQPQRTIQQESPKTPIKEEKFTSSTMLNDEDENFPSIEGLVGKKIIITVGATREKIDPVRFITNRSSGKMGFYLAKEALNQGANVTLISTINIAEPWIKDLKLIKVETCDEMYHAVFNEFTKSTLFTTPADALIMVAAVADFRPRNPSDDKIKKFEDNSQSNSTINNIVNLINQANDRAGNLMLEFEKTPDILFEVSKLKQPNQVMVGFSVETDNAIENARNKVAHKDLDFLVANSPDAFGAEQAEVTVVASKKRADIMPLVTTLPRQSKQRIAHEVLKNLAKCVEHAATDIAKV